jgi:hypothetical protein
MDQRSIVVLLHPKGPSTKAKNVHIEFVQVLGSDAIAYSIVTKYIGNDVILQNEPEAEDRAEDQGFSIADNAILKTLEMMPFASIRQIARMTFIPPATGFQRLPKSFHFVAFRRISSHFVAFRRISSHFVSLRPEAIVLGSP